VIGQLGRKVVQREDGKKEGGREEGCGASSAAWRVLGDRQTGRMIDYHREKIIAQVGIAKKGERGVVL